jgi:hypothetical protein
VPIIASALDQIEQQRHQAGLLRPAGPALDQLEMAVPVASLAGHRTHPADASTQQGLVEDNPYRDYYRDIVLALALLL